MPESRPRTDQILIKINGSDLPIELMNGLVLAEIETMLHLPSMFTLQFHDDKLRWVDEGPFDIGASVEIQLADKTTRSMETVFKGEITAVEPEFSEDSLSILIIRGYDRGHRLNRGTKTRAFIQTSDSDMVSKIAREAGLQSNVESTTQIYEHIFQHSQTDLAFLHERAERIGFEMFVDDRTLYFRKPKGSRGQVTLTWGDNLRSFRPRLSATKQVDTVVVKGWDPATKKEIVGQAASSDISPQVGVNGWGGSVAQQAFAAAKQIEVRQPAATQKDADNMAQSILDDINAGFIEAEGLAFGSPKLIAGEKVTLEKIGKRFGGKYIVTSARHIYATTGYDTFFTVEGARPRLMADLIMNPSLRATGTRSWAGLVPAIVTNNVDPKKMCRVKVKFPWLDDQLESDWARVIAPGAGNNRGIHWVPEVNDEVMVAFEHGDFNYPYIVGNVWNGKDAVPEDNAVQSGAVEIRTFRSREGHIIRLVDGSAQCIEILGADNVVTIKLDTKNKKLIIKSDGDIDVEAIGDMTLKGKNVNVEATGNMSMKANGTGAVQSTGPMTVKGAVVNIN